LIDVWFEVTGTVSSGVEALALTESGTLFDLALVDIRLTGELDGIELACLLRDKHSITSDFSFRAT